MTNGKLNPPPLFVLEPSNLKEITWHTDVSFERGNYGARFRRKTIL